MIAVGAFCSLQPLNPQGDYHVISSNSIATESNSNNDCQHRKFLIVKHILLLIIREDVQRTVWRICTLMLEC